MENSQLLCTFTKKKHINETVAEIKNIYNSVNKLFILENTDSSSSEVYCTYNVLISEIKDKSFLKNTISIHRNKATNTLYTINSINELVMLLNDGNKDKNFKINWENYKNTLIVTNENGLKKISTKLLKII